MLSDSAVPNLQETADARAKGRILIVDDVFDNREILSRRLQRSKFETTEASDGLEAIERLKAETFDVVLLDATMPRMGGIELLKWVRERFSASALPVIMVTAKGETTDIVEALDLGANDYITKPINFPVVLSRVSTQIERRRTALELQRTNETLKQTNLRLLQLNERLEDEISRRHRSDEKSAYLANHDALTGLANRHACDERLPEILRWTRCFGKGLAVLFLDLDGFKYVNDALGHAIGDCLLRDIATMMSHAVGPSDFLVRLGGDEFCILQVSDDPATAAPDLARTLIETIGTERTVEGQQVFISVSIGIAIADDSAVDAGEMLKRADMAMYRAKADGQGSYRLFSAEMDEVVRHRRSIEVDLRGALERDEFELHYQPIFDLRKNMISGFEALIRWERRSAGTVPPDKFIALAEETGLIVPIGEWALRRACEEAAHWPGDLRVAVNVSPVQLRSKSFLASVVRSIAESGLSPLRLELEVTESVLLRHNSDNLQILRDARSLGVRVAMDDFGTGYSSLGYFRSFQFDKVKIDRSFVSGFVDLDDSKAIVRAIVGLGRSFGMTTTAEGVETEDQLHYLRSEGVCEAQGYYFGRPQPAAATWELVKRFFPNASEPSKIGSVSLSARAS